MNEIRFSKEFGKEFSKLEKKSSQGSSEAAYLLRIIEKGISKLSQNIENGKKIQRKLWPKEYVQKYGLNNLWKLNLDSYWRLPYTIAGQEAKLIGIVIEVLNHKKYSRKFKYKK